MLVATTELCRGLANPIPFNQARWLAARASARDVDDTSDAAQSQAAPHHLCEIHVPSSRQFKIRAPIVGIECPTTRHGARKFGDTPNPRPLGALAEYPGIANTPGDPLLIEILHERECVLTARVEHITHLGNTDLVASAQIVDDPLAHLGESIGREGDIFTHPHDLSVSDKRRK